MSELQNLKKLSVTHNQLKEFPAQLVGLKNLDSVDLSHNRITNIPENIKSINAMEINLNQNQVWF